MKPDLCIHMPRILHHADAGDAKHAAGAAGAQCGHAAADGAPGQSPGTSRRRRQWNKRQRWRQRPDSSSSTTTTTTSTSTRGVCCIRAGPYRHSSPPLASNSGPTEWRGYRLYITRASDTLSLRHAAGPASLTGSSRGSEGAFGPWHHPIVTSYHLSSDRHSN